MTAFRVEWEAFVFAGARGRCSGVGLAPGLLVAESDGHTWQLVRIDSVWLVCGRRELLLPRCPWPSSGAQPWPGGVRCGEDHVPAECPAPWVLAPQPPAPTAVPCLLCPSPACPAGAGPFPRGCLASVFCGTSPSGGSDELSSRWPRLGAVVSCPL